MQLNEIITDRRKSLGMTKKQLAEKIGVAPPRIYEVENRIKYSGFEKVEKILDALGLTILPLKANAGRGKENKTGAQSQ